MKPVTSPPKPSEAVLVKPAPAPAPARPVNAPPIQYQWLAGLLSYLIPGLGQIYQGRIAKGVLFLVAIYGMFFYGMYLGSWSNVYLPANATEDENNSLHLPIFFANLYNRPQFAGQFWMGIATWPALIQYNSFDDKKDAHPWLGEYQRTPRENRLSTTQPKGQTLNELQTNGDKTWDVGWVFTVIAGVLNIMVIYDAVAGPALREVKAGRERQAT
jgi:TM2 domain-containing membrane protein YozV